MSARSRSNEQSDDQHPDGRHPEEQDFDPERLASCAYWRCGELFETRSVNHRYCRKACRSRQKKWERSQERKARKRR